MSSIIILFGSSGMLGRYVHHYLKKKYTVIPMNRIDYDIESNNISELTSIIIDKFGENNAKKILINCAGSIPQRININEINYDIYNKVNTLFPNHLQSIAEKYNFEFIHITTDCVFNGSTGKYNELSIHDATDIYGKSKSKGENPNACNIRTSIIGEELNNKKSFLEWVRNNKNNSINGYSNHLWNGVTCLQLAKIISTIIENNLYWKGTRHIHSPNTVTKYDLACYINEIYDLNLQINNFSTEINIDKSLTTIYNHISYCDSIYNQIKEQKNFSFL